MTAIADTGKELVAYAVCYNPRGAVKGAYDLPPAARPAPPLLRAGNPASPPG